jgi:predicted DNA-binding transcriptional regulator AlpA
MHQNGKEKGREAIEGQQHPASLLISINELSRLIKISPRSIRRGCQTGHIPSPVRVRSSVRWRLDVIKKWIADGCPSMDDGEMSNGQ